MELMVESGPDAGKVFQVGQTMLVVGRQVGVDILLNDDQISRRHASFEEVNNVLYLNDLGSANGSRLNGRTVTANQPLILSPGDRVQIGRTTLVVQSAHDEPTLTGLAGAFPSNNPYVSPAQPANASNAPNPYQPDQYQNQPPAGNYPNPSYNAPGPNQAYPGTDQSYSGPGAYAPPVPPAPIPYYPNIQVPVTPAHKKSSSGPIIAGIAGILIVAALALGAILLVSGIIPSTNNPTPQAQVTSTPETPGPIVPVMQMLVGPSGSNALPPPPPETTAGVTPTPGPGGPGTQGLGVAVTFPTGWKTTVDESQNLIESDAPDGITFSLVYRRSGLTGTPAERLTNYLKATEPNITNYTLTRPVQAASSDNSIADAYVTYTDKDGKLLQRDYIVATANKTGDTYFIHFSTVDASFDSQISTFNSILKSIVIN